MTDLDPLVLDPETVTDDEVDLAHSDVTPTAFPTGVDQDMPDAARGLTVVPNTPAQGLRVFKTMRENHTPIGGVGLCHYNCRHFGWNIPALWPDAETALEHGAPVHQVPMTAAGYASIPRGAQIGMANGGDGHSCTGLGSSLANSSDYHELGFNGVATIANLADWCGATRVVWYETVNGFDVWPDAAKPEPKPVPPKPFTDAERISILRHRMHQLREEGRDHRADRFKLWIAQIQQHQASQ